MSGKNESGTPSGFHVFEAPLQTNPTAVVVSKACLRSLGFDVEPGIDGPFLLTRDGISIIDLPDA